MKKVSESIEYKGITVEKTDVKECDFSNVEKMFVEYNFEGRSSPFNLLGQVNKLYRRDGVVKANFTIFNRTKYSIEFFKKSIDKLIPAIGGVVTRKKNGGIKKIKITTLSLGHNNTDSSILNLGKQEEISLKKRGNSKIQD